MISSNMLVRANTDVSSRYGAKSMTAISFSGELKHLKPQRVWELFEEMTKIYRESGPSEHSRENNKEISDYLVDKLANLGFEVEQVKDGAGKYNVFAQRNLNKKADNAIILQGHMDMVCISDDKNPKKPIKLNIEDDILKANNRTLGADNGIGLALAIAIAEEPKFKDLPLQIICTVDEETGMYGAAAMKPEDIKGQYLINIDSEKFGEVTIGCAGMDTFKEIQPVKTVSISSDSYRKLSISLSNATGGHSGEDINKGRINPIKTMLSLLADVEGIKLISMAGGDKANSIPRDVSVELLVPESKAQFIKDEFDASLSNIKEQHKQYDPKLTVETSLSESNVSSDTQVIDSQFQNKLLSILGKQMHVGMKSVYDNGDTKTSQNIGIIDLKDGKIELQISMRSSDSKEIKEMHNKTCGQLSELLDKKVVPFNSSPIWEPKLASNLTKLAKQAYIELGAKNPRVYTCHGGLENAQFAQKRPDIDQISIGPDIYDPHTVNERVTISSVDKIYKFIELLLSK
ncbi:MAG: beta-Ala-His dipeptidase, partial [Vampirovibrionia bacterium]